MNRTIRLACFALVSGLSAAALAQPAPAAATSPTPTAAPAAPAAAPPPAWKQGMSAEQAQSPLHPFAAHMTGRASSELPIDKLKVPPGFKVEVWAEGIPESRSLAVGDKGTVFVSNRILSNVYAVVDRGGKREVKTLFKGLSSPNGIVFHKGTLYVAERHRITRYDGIEDALDSPPQAVVVVDNLDPTKQAGHFWKYLALGPDGKLYFNIGSPQNIIMPTAMESAILRVDPQTKIMEQVALGVRNSVGMTFHPTTKQLWFTDHARDWMGEDMPSDELNVLTRKGEHFGFPFCHQGNVPDPQFGANRSCAEFTPPKLNLGAHVAPMGLRFYTGNMFPKEYRNNLFIAQKGSWNRTIKQGYNVVRVSFDSAGKPKTQPFLEGFLVDEKADPPMWGRPTDLLQMPDGALLVSDDYNGIIYRVSYGK